MDTPVATLTVEEAQQQTLIDARFAMWRFHLWHLNYGSYNAIERKIAQGKLTAFVCPKQECDCSWPKHAEQKKEQG